MVNMAIVVDDFNDYVVQALGAAMTKSGGSLLITYSFGVVFIPISAGTHQITVWMESDYGRPTEFRESTVFEGFAKTAIVIESEGAKGQRNGASLVGCAPVVLQIG
jgi:hypothetical protein